MNDDKKGKKRTSSNPADKVPARDTYEYVDMEIEALRNILDRRKKHPGPSSSAKEKKPDSDNPETAS